MELAVNSSNNTRVKFFTYLVDEIMKIKPAEPLYGSDKDGLVWGYYFLPGQPAQAVNSDTVAEKLATPLQPPPDSFLWLHFSLSNAAAMGWMQRHLSLPDAFYESLNEPVGTTRLEQEADALVTVIHDALFDFTFDASAVSTANLCITPHLLVSARLHPLRSVDQLRAAVKAGQVFRSPADLLAHLLRDQVHVLVDILRRTTSRVDTIEDKLLAHRVPTSRGELGALRRMLVRLQRLLAPEPAAFFRLINHPPNWIAGEDLQDLREAAEEFSAAVVDSATLVERVKLLQEELAALVNEQTNRTLFILTVVTVLALPINLVAGLFGMNVGGIPFSQHDFGFFLIVGSLATITAFLAYLALSKYRK